MRWEKWFRLVAAFSGWEIWKATFISEESLRKLAKPIGDVSSGGKTSWAAKPKLTRSRTLLSHEVDFTTILRTFINSNRLEQVSFLTVWSLPFRSSGADFGTANSCQVYACQPERKGELDHSRRKWLYVLVWKLQKWRDQSVEVQQKEQRLQGQSVYWGWLDHKQARKS